MTDAERDEHGTRTGARLGHYELLARLGAGGMGEVYRARDVQLEREVAVKLLPPDVSADRHRLERFGQEARAAARLSHPNILAVYDLAAEGSDVFLVSELLEGRTLRERLAEGALPWRKAVDYALQICAGLAAAHERGIVHCDLKPENVFITGEDRIKILDFGLARLRKDPLGAEEPTATVTLHSSATIHGTLGYMAPEQIRRAEVDARADLFSLGTILYEMLAGHRAFPVGNPAETLGSILKEDPPPLRPVIPGALARIVGRCMEKEPAARFRSAHDLGFALEAVAGSREEWGERLLAWVPVRHAGWRRALYAGALAAAVGLAYYAGFRLQPVKSAQAVRFSLSLPEGSGLVEFTAAPMAITADGESLILALADDRGTRLWRRRLDSEAFTPIEGSEGATSPFLSPNGQWIAFAADGKVKRISIGGGTAQVVADAQQFFGGCWLDDQTIVYVPRAPRGLWQVSTSGGRPVQLTVPSGADDIFHIWPACLPDGRTVLFSQWRGGKQIDESAIAYVTRDGRQKGVLVDGAYHARYLREGQLLFARVGTLMAVPFDLRSLELRGQPRPIVNGVLANVNSQVAFYETSNTAHLAVVQGQYEQPQRRLVWVDRNGIAKPASGLSKPFSSPRTGSDGRQVLTWLQDDEVAVWLLELGQGGLSKLSRGIDDHSPVWSPDGKQVAFDSTRSGRHQLYLAAADRPGQEVQLTSEPRDHFVNVWLPDGRLAYTDYSVEDGGDIWLIEPRAGAEPQPLVQTPFSEQEPAFSADGRWVAYVSDETRAKEVYVQRFPLAGPRVPVSRNGGEEPLWSRSGSELFYRKGRDMFAVEVTGGDQPRVSTPRVLFSGRFHYNLYPTTTYDVAADGRFLMVEEAPPARRPIHVALHLGDALDSAARQPDQ